MFEVQKPKQKPVVVIRAASAAEFSVYKNRKLVSAEKNAQENKIDTIEVEYAPEFEYITPYTLK